ncbi:MAG: hypothetical protein ACLQMH_15735 [Solirubrobacteraceae bacterium]
METPNEDDARVRAMKLPALYDRLREAARDPLSASPAEVIALLEEASSRLFAADLLLNGVPKQDDLLAASGFLSEEHLRELLEEGLGGANFEDIRIMMDALEDEMRGDADATS